MAYTSNDNFKYLELNSGGALIFQLSNGNLSVSSKDDKNYKLTSSITDSVKYFDVCSKEVSGKTQVRIAIATQTGKTCGFYLSTFIDAEEQILNNFSGWTAYPMDSSMMPDLTSLGEICVFDSGCAVALNPEGSDAYYNVLVDSVKKWEKYELPINAPTIIKQISGTVYGDNGLFFLLQIDNDQSLMFQSFKDPKYGKTSTYRFDCTKNKINTIQAVKMQDNNTQLYAMYDTGILLFENPDKASTRVFTPENDFLINDFSVKEYSTKAKAIWALEQEDQEDTKDDQTHYNLSYFNDIFPDMKFCLVIKQ